MALLLALIARLVSIPLPPLLRAHTASLESFPFLAPSRAPCALLVRFRALVPRHANLVLQGKEKKTTTDLHPPLNDPPPGDKFDINTATQAQLESIKGIGPKKAQAILEYIAAHAPITDINQLIHVKGVGKKTLENIKNSAFVAP